MMARTIHAPRGTQLTCKNWLIEAPYRMLQNNLDPQVAGDPEHLIVYGGRGEGGGEPVPGQLLAHDLADPHTGRRRASLIRPRVRVSYSRSAP